MENHPAREPLEDVEVQDVEDEDKKLKKIAIISVYSPGKKMRPSGIQAYREKCQFKPVRAVSLPRGLLFTWTDHRTAYTQS